MTELVYPDVSVLLEDVAAPVKIVGGSMTLDSSDVPYAQAVVQLPLTVDTPLDPLDPQDDTRVIVQGSNSGHWDTGVWVQDPPRLFNLGLRSRAVDDKAKTVTLDLASDEKLLTDYVTLAEDKGARAHEGSLRAVCNYVLAKIGAVLQPGGPDVSVKAFWRLTNLHRNSVPRVGITGYSSGFGVSNVARSTSVQWNALPTVQFNAANAGEAYLNTPTVGIRVTPDQVYTHHFQLLSASAARPVRIMVRWKDAAGTVLRTDFTAPVNSSTGAWTRYVYTGTAPPNAVQMEAFPNVVSNAAGQSHFASGFMTYPGDEIIDWFDGGSAVAGYTVAYDDPTSPATSTSTRAPLVERPPDLFAWVPGTSAWDFLVPLTSSVGLRLFCDELRVWRLIDPGTFEVPGYVVVSGLNAVEGVDTISREDAEVFATGVVVRYAWKDDEGVARTAHDTAGTPQRVVVIDYARPYPGPGAAAAILARRAGTGRTQSVDGLARWEATPGMTASITLPSAPEQLGKVTSVRWALTNASTMALGTRGLIDVPDGSWLDWNPAQAWQDVADSVTWASLP